MSINGIRAIYSSRLFHLSAEALLSIWDRFERVSGGSPCWHDSGLSQITSAYSAAICYYLNGRIVWADPVRGRFASLPIVALELLSPKWLGMVSMRV
jgi:hypothetical protein